MPITIELPDLKSQTRFNLDRWTEIAADPRLAKLPDRIETDRHGHILMTPPPGFPHSDRQGNIADLLKDLLPNGRTLAECPLSTADGVKAIDLAWLARGRAEFRERPLVLTSAPEICIEVFSPSNTRREIDEKRALYFDACAAEVWICNLDGSITFSVSPIINSLPRSFARPFHRRSREPAYPAIPRVALRRSSRCSLGRGTSPL